MVLLDQALAVNEGHDDLAGLRVLAAVHDDEVAVVDAELLDRGAVNLEEDGAFRACNQELVDVELAVFEVLHGGRKPADTLERPTGSSSFGACRAGSQASAGKGGPGWQQVP